LEVSAMRGAVARGAAVLAIGSVTAPGTEAAGMVPEQTESSQPRPRAEPGPFVPGPMAPVAGEDGRVVLDDEGNPVMAPVTPPDGTAGVLPPGTTRRTVGNPDGTVSEQVSIAYE
jgi:hypothetical protein